MAVLHIRTGWPSRKLSPNGRFHFREKAKATRTAKNDGYYSTVTALSARTDWFQFKAGPGRLSITIRAFPPVRPQGGGNHPDADNLIASAKSYLDGIAAALGVDDKQFDILGVAWEKPAKLAALQFEIERVQ